MSLPDANDPLVLADGTVINPTTGEPERARQRFIDVPTHSQAQQAATSFKRKLIDMPAPPQHMNGISLVVLYTMYGLSDADIATLLDVDEKQIGRMRMHDAYTKMYNEVVQGIIQQDKDSVQTLLSQASHGAARRVIAIAEQDEDDALAFAASKDILDRAGHRAQDTANERMANAMTGLTINIKRATSDDDVPDVSITLGDSE